VIDTQDSHALADGRFDFDMLTNGSCEYDD
jgi:hypothetical protein